MTLPLALQISMTHQANHTFWLRSEHDGIFIGNTAVAFEGNNIFVDGVRYKGTPVGGHGQEGTRNAGSIGSGCLRDLAQYKCHVPGQRSPLQDSEVKPEPQVEG